jgi:hypothetical protein
MPPFFTILLMTAAGAGVLSWASTVAGHDTGDYLWKNRLLILFSATPTDLAYKAFDRSLSKRLAEVRDRDLVVFHVFEHGASSAEDRPLPPETAEGLRHRFGVEPGRFCVILIGKDGGVKMSQTGRGDLQKIFDRIDTMPMRQREMREKNNPP